MHNLSTQTGEQTHEGPDRKADIHRNPRRLRAFSGWLYIDVGDLRLAAERHYAKPRCTCRTDKARRRRSVVGSCNIDSIVIRKPRGLQTCPQPNTSLHYDRLPVIRWWPKIRPISADRASQLPPRSPEHTLTLTLTLLLTVRCHEPWPERVFGSASDTGSLHRVMCLFTPNASPLSQTDTQIDCRSEQTRHKANCK